VAHATELVCRNSSGKPADDTDDICWIDEGKDCPRLWWEAVAIDD
jgi:hypothetical protein